MLASVLPTRPAMTRLAGVSVLVVAALAGCTSGDEMVGNDTLGRLCTAQLTTSGSFTQSQSRPIVNGIPKPGCWPVGMWTFTVSVGSSDCAPKPTPLSQYQFSGDYTLDNDGNVIESFMYVTDPTIHHIVKVSEGGSGSCEGELDLYSADGTQVWTLKPELNADNTLSGDGEFDEYSTDQWKGTLGGP